MQQNNEEWLFGEYRVIRLLGKGGFGDVYLGEHLREKAPVAIKVLQESLTNENIREFVTEAGTQRLLRHEHIVRLLDFGIGTNQLPFLVMEYAPGGSLAARHPPGSRLPFETILSYLQPLSAALQYAHDRGLIHRDIKPANFLIGTNGKILLSDFGIAAIALSTRSREQHREEQKLVGSWAYAAPEQFVGKAVPASDQYSLAVVVYEWLCGQRPFQGNFDQLVVQHYHLKSPPPPLHEKMSILPAIEQVIMRALAKGPEHRFESVQSFAEAIVTCSVSGSYSKPQLMTPPMNDPTPVVPPTVLPLPPAQAPHPAEPAAIPKAPAAVCELEVGGWGCGIQAVGRCAICGRAFCATHQGRQGGWGDGTFYDRGRPYIMCAACYVRKKADEAERQRKFDTELNEASAFFKSGSARIALLTAGVRPVKIYQIHRQWKTGLFGLGSRYVDAVTSLHGWILGDLSGQYTSPSDSSFPNVHHDCGLTALLDMDKGILTRVEPYLDSYKQVEYLRDHNWEIPDNSFYILVAEEAVKGLVESSRRGIQNVFTRSIPTEHERSPKQIQAPASKSGFIRIEEGKEPGRTYEIHKEALSIGGDAEGDLLFEGSYEGCHLQATVINQGNGNYSLRVEDLTLLNGQPLDKGRFFPLQEGDRIKLGRTVVVFGTK